MDDKRHTTEERSAPDEVVIKVGTTLEEAEKRLIQATVERYPSKPQAAQMLGISLKTLYNKLKAHLIERRARG